MRRADASAIFFGDFRGRLARDLHIIDNCTVRAAGAARDYLMADGCHWIVTQLIVLLIAHGGLPGAAATDQLATYRYRTGWEARGSSAATAEGHRRLRRIIALAAAKPPGTNRYFANQTVDPSVTGLNRWQLAFVLWNAQRLGISVEASAQRWVAAFKGVANFRQFTQTTFKVLAFYASDSRAEVYDAYRLSAPQITLRMVSYPVPYKCGSRGFGKMAATLTTLAESLTARREVLRIFDYGAGVPQTSLCLAEEVRTKHPGAQVELHLADIRTPRREFLAWYCAEIDGVACVFYDIEVGADMPTVPPVHAWVALEVFEHLHPQQLELAKVQLANSLQLGGVLLTALGNHPMEFFHVNPHLRTMRTWVAQQGLRLVTMGRNEELYVRDSLPPRRLQQRAMLD